MKRIVAACLLLGLAPVLMAQAGKKPPKKEKPATGYELQLQIKPFKNQWVYLAYYYGNIKAMADSAYLDANSRGVFKGKEPLPEGVYIVASPSKTILFELIIGAKQKFSLSADSSHPDESLRFIGSPDNSAFQAYSHFIAPIARASEQAREQLKKDSTALTRKKYQAIIDSGMRQIETYRNKVIGQQPGSVLALIFKTMKEPVLPKALQHAKTRQDSVAQYRYVKEHYWDEMDLMDGRLVRTPTFAAKLQTYLDHWVSPEPDSLIYESNWMIALGRNDDAMFKYLVGYFVDHYMYPKIMGQDKVFLHVYQKYISGNNPQTDWLSENQKKIINDRAYMLMANQLGAKAWDMQMVDTAGKTQTLFSIQAEYTVVAFWDVNCGHCKEELPRMDTLYETQWKQHGVKIYAVMVNEEIVREWPAFIRQHAPGWVHVHQPLAIRQEEEKLGKPNFRQLYDMRTTPTLFLLDKEKRIIAKNIDLAGLDKLLHVKFDENANAH